MERASFLASSPDPALYRTVLERLNAGFCIIEVIFDDAGVGVDYRFVEVNEAFSRNTGLSNVCGQRMSSLQPGHESDWYRTYGEVARSGQARQFEMEARALNRWYSVEAVSVGEPD
ncbi:MAG TPA: hybrid sensor histidine kinase/response regulator, partial [Stenotrophomonas sp.]|nr:hybrid sensor histidine kinase/response regulator [Stenotrophomonas sp.]